MKRSYKRRIADLTKKLGSGRAVARALGVSYSTLRHRLEKPSAVREEHELALDSLERQK